jgi:23S rRNA (uracil1939-C5)-methyltransferase
MHPSTYSTLLLLAPKEFIYVSCNPSTLVRDLEELTKDGKYEITMIQPVDMFPHTHHIETIVRLEKKDL